MTTTEISCFSDGPRCEGCTFPVIPEGKQAVAARALLSACELVERGSDLGQTLPDMLTDAGRLADAFGVSEIGVTAGDLVRTAFQRRQTGCDAQQS